MKILLLEDDPIISDNLLDFLHERYKADHVFDADEALKRIEEGGYDLYIFDINLPGTSGIELLKELRAFNDNTPAIFITAYQDVSYLKEAFGIGANDFIRKPFELEELGARIENICRQLGLENEIALDEQLIFETAMHQIKSKEKHYNISPKESEVLHYLIKNAHRVVSTDELLQNIWAYDEMPSDDTIRTYIKKLRTIIGKERIINVRGQGYRFE